MMDLACKKPSINQSTPPSSLTPSSFQATGQHVHGHGHDHGSGEIVVEEHVRIGLCIMFCKSYMFLFSKKQILSIEAPQGKKQGMSIF